MGTLRALTGILPIDIDSVEPVRIDQLHALPREVPALGSARCDGWEVVAQRPAPDAGPHLRPLVLRQVHQTLPDLVVVAVLVQF